MASVQEKIPQLKPDNFNNWIFRVQCILDEKQLLHTITIDDSDDEDFVKANAKAKSIIVQCIPDKYLNIIKSCQTAKDMINILKNMFERKSIISIIHLRRKLLNLKQKSDEKLEDPCPQYSTSRRKPIFRRDRHLQSALHRGEIDYLFKNWHNHAGLKKEHLLLKRDTKNVTFLDSDQYIHWALLHVSGRCKESSTGRELSRHIRAANEATNIGAQDYCGVSVAGPSTNPPPLLQQTYCLKKKLTRITHNITFSEKHSATYDFFGCKGRCYGNLHVVWSSDQFAYVITHSHFLAVRDCINAWFSALSYGLAALRKYPMYNLYNKVANVIYAALHDITVYKDDAYDILKSWQPLVIASILQDIEGDPSFMVSLLDVVNKFPHSMLIRIATRHVTTSSDVHIALELTGLTKCFGHPEIVMDESVAAWVEKGTTMKKDLEEVAEEIRRAFILEFSRNYYI